MLSLNELLAPITLDQFRADYEGRKPLHIPAATGAGKRTLLDWTTFNRLLSQTALWNASNLKLVHNNAAIPPHQYCIETRSQSGMILQPSPTKVETLIALEDVIAQFDFVPEQALRDAVAVLEKAGALKRHHPPA